MENNKEVEVSGTQEERPWPSDGGMYEIAFAVSVDGDAFLVTAPESVRNANDESASMDKHYWDDLPTAPGFYKAKAEYWFQEGYYEGYPAPGESSDGWTLHDCTPLNAIQGERSEPTPPNPLPQKAG